MSVCQTRRDGMGHNYTWYLLPIQLLTLHARLTYAVPCFRWTRLLITFQCYRSTARTPCAVECLCCIEKRPWPVECHMLRLVFAQPARTFQSWPLFHKAKRFSFPLSSHSRREIKQAGGQAGVGKLACASFNFGCFWTSRLSARGWEFLHKK